MEGWGGGRGGGGGGRGGGGEGGGEGGGGGGRVCAQYRGRERGVEWRAKCKSCEAHENKPTKDGILFFFFRLFTVTLYFPLSIRAPLTLNLPIQDFNFN